MEVPPLGASFPKWGNAFSMALGRWAMRLAGWRFEGVMPDVPQSVLIVAPHTSNWDFAVGLSAKFALGMAGNWLGKHTIFVWPLGPVWRWLGGIPVDRKAATGVVDDALAAIRRSRQICVVIAPEGTRKRVDRWKNGFHRIAVAADIPVLPVVFDYSRRVVALLPAERMSGDLEKDLARLQSFYRPTMAYRAENYGVPFGSM
jgi:1-acyl-sn-glycerol-3-phosphate acyltransferase